MAKVTVREVIEMLVIHTNWDDECTCIAKCVSEKINEGKEVFDVDTGPEIDELGIDRYKYKIVGVSQFEGVEGKGVQIIFEGD